MGAGEWLKQLLRDKKLPILIAMLLCGAVLIGFSYHLNAAVEESAPTDAQTADGTANAIERRLSSVLSQIIGAGNVDVLVTEKPDGEIMGVLVIADGAKELTVRTELMRAAMTALDVPASSVEVFARNAKEELP